MKKTDVVAFAWQAHQSQENWTGKADIKGSILLAVDGTVLAAIVTAKSSGVCISNPLWLLSLLALAASAILAGLSVKPSLKSRKRKPSSDLIYFGHLKDEDPVRLSEALSQLSFENAIDGLSRQLVAMSQGNWKKHRLLVASTWCVISAIPLLLAALIAG